MHVTAPRPLVFRRWRHARPIHGGLAQRLLTQEVPMSSVWDFEALGCSGCRGQPPARSVADLCRTLHHPASHPARFHAARGFSDRLCAAAALFWTPQAAPPCWRTGPAPMAATPWPELPPGWPWPRALPQRIGSAGLPPRPWIGARPRARASVRQQNPGDGQVLRSRSSPTDAAAVAAAAGPQQHPAAALAGALPTLEWQCGLWHLRMMGLPPSGPAAPSQP
mmetsp:Transcript_18841/g.47991  ORF Transcript_18841/g.47991 Transcript_18841/m.47991 type:complete len:222 (-) Transcript_18841:1624-2289(-)